MLILLARVYPHIICVEIGGLRSGSHRHRPTITEELGLDRRDIIHPVKISEIELRRQLGYIDLLKAAVILVILFLGIAPGT